MEVDASEWLDFASRARKGDKGAMRKTRNIVDRQTDAERREIGDDTLRSQILTRSMPMKPILPRCGLRIIVKISFVVVMIVVVVVFHSDGESRWWAWFWLLSLSLRRNGVSTEDKSGKWAIGITYTIDD